MFRWLEASSPIPKSVTDTYTYPVPKEGYFPQPGQQTPPQQAPVNPGVFNNFVPLTPPEQQKAPELGPPPKDESAAPFTPANPNMVPQQDIVPVSETKTKKDTTGNLVLWGAILVAGIAIFAATASGAPAARLQANPRSRRKFPSEKEVADDLRDINANIEAFDEEWIDVRLLVWPDSHEWKIVTGDVGYDQQHAPAVGAASIPGVYRGTVRRFNSTEVAKDLLSQAKDMWEQ